MDVNGIRVTILDQCRVFERFHVKGQPGAYLVIQEHCRRGFTASWEHVVRMDMIGQLLLYCSLVR